jgi:hypothetical protein
MADGIGAGPLFGSPSLKIAHLRQGKQQIRLRVYKCEGVKLGRGFGGAVAVGVLKVATAQRLESARRQLVAGENAGFPGFEQVGRPVLRECLEALYRASGVSDANDLALVGVYDRVPIGAISGASSTPNGLELRLSPGGGGARGLLVVGRRRSSGALVTAEVATQIAPK